MSRTACVRAIQTQRMSGRFAVTQRYRYFELSKNPPFSEPKTQVFSSRGLRKDSG